MMMLRSPKRLLMLRMPHRTQIVRNARPVFPLMTDEEVKRAASELSEFLDCEPERFIFLMRTVPRIRRKTPELLLGVAKNLTTYYSKDTIVRYAQILEKDWYTIQQRRFMLEEMGVPFVRLSHVTFFPYVMSRTIPELKRMKEMIPPKENVVLNVLTKIPNCPSSFCERVQKVLSPAITEGLPLINIWKTIVMEYLSHWMPNENLSFLERRPSVHEQSLRILYMKMNLLTNLFSAGNSIIKEFGMLVGDAFNMQAVVDRVHELATHPFEQIVRKEPRILLTNVDRLCEVESILKDYQITPDHVWCCPRIYLFHPDDLRKRFKELSEVLSIRLISRIKLATFLLLLLQSRKFFLLRGDVQMLYQVTKGLRHPVHRLNNESMGKYNCLVVLKIINSRFSLSKDKKADLRQKLGDHRAGTWSKADIFEAADFLIDEIGFSTEQILSSPALLLYSVKTLREGWRTLTQMDYVKEIRNTTDWQKSNLASQMLHYEIENDPNLALMEFNDEAMEKLSCSIDVSPSSIQPANLEKIDF
ncbi:hypothetical protein BIW11_12845 [Tropilaelaps mercedesae]|uniref:Uncharacterized protein n=1 Tax=Tropilaelaps mercedesae TaxID=418985 RepID=A0A1V9X5I7_9ACAR|nr:hypothetical protein BIW11_12845 [Tropilaelaps mercedesae]